MRSQINGMCIFSCFGSQIIANSQHFVGHFAPGMYECFHPLDTHPSGAPTCQALCWVQTRVLRIVILRYRSGIACFFHLLVLFTDGW